MQYANMFGYSDIHAHEVVKQVSDKTIEVRRMEAKLLNGAGSGEPDALQFSPGGFCGHTSGTQRYEFSSNGNAPRIRLRLHKDGKWYDRYGHKFVLSDKPVEHYDFNF